MNYNRSLYKVVEDTCNNFKNESALYFENHEITYEKLLMNINKVASVLHELGVKDHDIITVCMPNMPQAIYSFYAINKLGAICYEIHPKSTLQQVRKYLRETKSKFLLVLDIFAYQFLELQNEMDLTVITFNPFDKISLIKKIYCNMKSPKHVEPNTLRYEKLEQLKYTETTMYNWDIHETSVLLNSGGTSGNSKIIELSTDAINKLASNGSDILDMTEGVGVHMFLVLPMFHGFGLCMGVHAPLMYGASISLMMKFHTKDTINLIKKNRATIIIGVPILYKALLKNKKFHSNIVKNINFAYVGGDFVNQDLFKKFNDLMIKHDSKARLFEGYGLTETVTVCSVNTLAANCDESVGKAVRYAKIKIVDPTTKQNLPHNTLGEIAVSGDIIMNGYYNDDELTNKTVQTDEFGNKWVLTGDYGYLNNEDYLFFKQRLKRIIKVSGVIICPSDIEHVVSKMDEIFEVYASGVEDEEHGSIIYLWVVKNKNPEYANISDEELNKKIKDLIKNELSIYAMPKGITYIEKMPKTEIGKIDGKILEQMIKEK